MNICIEFELLDAPDNALQLDAPNRCDSCWSRNCASQARR